MNRNSFCHPGRSYFCFTGVNLYYLPHVYTLQNAAACHENPVSSQEVKLTGTPFFATYRKGTIQECGVVASEEGIRAMLRQLLQPVSL